LSSILKALKKIEEESPPPQSFPSLPKAIDTKQAINSKARKRWLVRRLITSFLILLVIMVAAVILFSQRQRMIAKIFPPGSSVAKKEKVVSTSDNSNLFRAKIPPASAKPAAGPPKQTRPAKREIKPTAPGSNVKKIQADTRSLPPEAGIGRRNPKVYSAGQSSRSEAKYKGPLKKKPPLQNVKIHHKSIAGRSAASNKSVAGAKKSIRTKTFDRINVSKLKLQALAWFSDTSRRMAVINGRIVREGESVDGYQIAQIRRDDVVVNDGKKSWSLEFGLK